MDDAFAHQCIGDAACPLRITGPPAGGGEAGGGNRSGPEGLHKPAPTLAVRAGEPRLADRRPRWVGSGPASPPPRTRGRQGTAGAPGRACRAPDSPDLNERLVPYPAPSPWNKGVSDLLHRSRRQCRTNDRPGKDTSDVHVDHPDVAFEGEGEHSSRRVGADPGERLQRPQIAGHGAAVLPHHLSGGGVEVHGPAVVAEPRPGPHHLAHRFPGAGRRSREAAQEGPVRLHHPAGLGLLQHELAHEHRPRVAHGSPRKGAQLCAGCEHGAPHGTPARRRQLQTSPW